MILLASANAIFAGPRWTTLHLPGRPTEPVNLVPDHEHLDLIRTQVQPGSQRSWGSGQHLGYPSTRSLHKSEYEEFWGCISGGMDYLLGDADKILDHLDVVHVFI